MLFVCVLFLLLGFRKNHMAFVLNDIGASRDGGNLGDVVTFTKKKLRCEEDTCIFWSLEKLVCVCV